MKVSRLTKKNVGTSFGGGGLLRGGGHVLDIRPERIKAATMLAEMKTMVAPLVEWTNNSDDECDEFQMGALYEGGDYQMAKI